MQIQFVNPQFTRADAMELAKGDYDLTVSAESLPSERDQNFLLRAENGDQYVLKLSREPMESIDLQNQVLHHLAIHLPDMKIPRICPSVSGSPVLTRKVSDGSEYHIRLLRYVSGNLMALTKPHSKNLLFSLGKVLGLIDAALLTFEHPAAHRDLKWDVARASWSGKYLEYIEDPEKQTLARRFLSVFEERAIPLFSKMRSSIIYNDANDYNVIVEWNEATSQVIGVIDFGDVVYTKTICEVAVAAAYAMLDKPDPLSAAVSVVSGYHSANPISEIELQAIYPLICGRLCTTVANAAYQRKVNPDNHYLAISEESAWNLLKILKNIPADLPHYRFRHACGFPPVPGGEKIVRWLIENRHQMGRLIPPDLNRATVVDLRVGSFVAGNPCEPDHTSRFWRRVQDQILESKTTVGIGRYGEARVLSQPEAWRVEGNEGPEWRTVHLGLDLFVEPGTLVYAPLDGIIHAFADNIGPNDYGPTIILKHIVDQDVVFYTLYGHLSSDSLDNLHGGMFVRKGTVLGRVGWPPQNGGWPSHLHLQILTDLLENEATFPGNALPSQLDFWVELCPDPNLIVGISSRIFEDTGEHDPDVLTQRSFHISKSFSVSYQKPLHIVLGSMQYLYDRDGRAYLDLVNNVAHVGHCRPEVVEAGRRQMSVLNTNTRYLHEYLGEYAERLCATLPEPLRVCFFVNSGSEANELALRLARTHTGSQETVVLEAGYHGNTSSLIEVSSYKFDGPGGRGAPPHVHKVPLPDIYRGPHRRADPNAASRYVGYIQDCISDLRSKGKVPGTFLCEAMAGCGGQIVPPEEYLKLAYQAIREAGGVCIADEVQTGFGRVGTHFWAFETQGVIPDIVTMGKPIGNGHPIGAVVTSPEIAASFCTGMEYFNTFGGNPVSCAIGMAVLNVLEKDRLQSHAHTTGSYLMSGLGRLMKEHPLIGDVRGSGLFIGVELVKDRATLLPAVDEATYLINRLRERGVLLSIDGPLHNVIKIKPPLVVNRRDMDFLLEQLDIVLGEDSLRS